MDANALVRFWANVDRRGPDDCWPWIGLRYSNGYGRYADREHRGWSYAHRLIMEIKNGAPVPKASWVCHHCDNPPCVNPAHLYIGNASTNAQDRERRNRGNRGSRIGQGLGRHFQGKPRTHCKRGHEFTPENTWVSPTRGVRLCFKCLKVKRAKQIQTQILAYRASHPGWSLRVPLRERSHCRHGHPLTTENLTTWGGKYGCRVCHSAEVKRWKANKKAALQRGQSAAGVEAPNHAGTTQF